MKAKKQTRPIDVKDTLWSVLGKDALDAAAERLWNFMRENAIVWDFARDAVELPYHLQDTHVQEAVQRAVLDQLGTTAVVLLRQRAKEIRRNGASADEYTALLDLADELEGDHG
jgi:hypothetical protein